MHWTSLSDNPEIDDASAFGVIVVDDDEMMAEFVAMELEAFGCSPRVATSGEAAIAAIDEHTGFVITDRKMPGMDGMDLVRQLRDSARSGSHLHIAMMTTRGDEAVIREALDAGVDDFLYKPIEPLQLELAVASAKRYRRLYGKLNRRNELLSTAHGKIREALRNVRSDISAAAALHTRLLPKPERLPGLDFALLYRPAATIGGDTIGAADVGNGKTLFFIIDVVGHGVPAALDSFHLHHRLKQIRPRDAGALERAMSSLNREILERGDERYATLICGLMDPADGSVSLIVAGHPPPVLQRSDRTEVIELEAAHPLGWFADTHYRVTRIELAEGDRLAIYSDGLSDRLEADDTASDDNGLTELMAGLQTIPLDKMGEELERRLGLGRNAQAPEDDVSLLIVTPSGQTQAP